MKIVPILRKELKDLIRERVVLFGMIIGPLLIFGIMGAVMNLSFKAAEKEAVKPVKVAVADLDGSAASRLLLAYLGNMTNTKVIEPPNDPVDTLNRLYDSEGIEALLLIPKSFGNNLSSGLPARVMEYIYVSKPSLMSLPSTGRLTSYIEGFNKLVLLKAVRNSYPDATVEFVSSPVSENSSVILMGRPVGSPEELMQFMFAQVLILPLALFVAVIAAIQVAAVSMAIEKEAKTIEMLLSLPVSRTEILAGKLLGVSLIAVIGASSYTLGFLVYMKAIPSVGAGSLLTTLGLIGSALYFVALLLGLLISIGIGILTSVFVSDVKSAQIVSSYISFPLIFPIFVFMFGVTLEDLPGYIQALMNLDPYVHMLKAFLGIVTGDYSKVTMGLAGMVIYLLVLMYAASRLFSSERLLTSQVTLRRPRRAR